MPRHIAPRLFSLLLAAAPAHPLCVWFEKPARTMEKSRITATATGTRTRVAEAVRKINLLESLPIGKGRLGAMDCGGVDLERIILNESSVLSGGEYDANKHNEHKALSEIRRRLFAAITRGRRRSWIKTSVGSANGSNPPSSAPTGRGRLEFGR